MILKIYNHLPIFLTIILSALSQMILKYRLITFDKKLSSFQEYYNLLVSYEILLCIMCIVASVFFWITALSKFSLGYCYIFLSFLFILIPILDYLFFEENYNLFKLAGSIVIAIGVILSNKY